MSQSLSKVYIHIIFSTKDRFKYLAELKTKNELYSYINGILKNKNSICIKIGGTSDHIHILCTLPRQETQSNFIGEIKRISSIWIKENYEGYLTKFQWQNGYGTFSVSQSNIKTVSNYINNQEEHHKTVTFQEEYLKFLEKYKIDYNVEYLWN